MSEETLPNLYALPTNTFTIQDVILDSPVWRANVVHLEDQIDQFEKWIDGFLRGLKNYIEVVHKYNTQTSNLCKLTFFHGLDGTLIDNKTAGNVVTKFATTLQSTIAHKTKMVSDLEELLLNPLQNLLKNDLKTFKESRKQYEKTLDRYETQLYRYYVLSKQKEPSGLREDAFQMYEQRRLHLKSTTDHFGNLVSFKANLDNLLVECFSGALSVLLEELDESVNSFQLIRLKVTGWKQWLEESNVTTEYQLNKIKRRSEELQQDFILKTKPPRSLKYYTIKKDISNLNEIDIINSNKQGYLNSRIMVGKIKPSWSRRWFFLQEGWFGTCQVITLNKTKGCIQLSDRVKIKDCKIRITLDLDRRFSFEVTHPLLTYQLQAETQEEMECWIKTMKRNLEGLDEPESTQPELLLSPPDSMKTIISNPNGPSVVSMSTSPLMTAIDTQTISTQSTTTSSLVQFILKQKIDSNKNQIKPIESSQVWSWLSSEEPIETGILIWPDHLKSQVVLPEISHYSETLKENQKELRTLFSNVPSHEVVIETFSASLYRQPSMDEEGEDGAIDTSPSYGYSGQVRVTQDHIWFYSCNLITCVNMLIIPIETIKKIRLEKTYHSNGSLMMIETETQDVCFGLWLEPVEMISEKLKYILRHQGSLQELYDHVRHMTVKTKTPPNRLTTSISLHASVTPLTIQAVLPEESSAQDALEAVAVRNQLKPWSLPTPPPSQPIPCSCPDHDQTEIDMIFPVSPLVLFNLLFKQPDVWEKLNQSKTCTAPTFSSWENNQRIMEYIMPVSNPMVKAKEALVNETQELIEHRDQVCYVVTVTTRTPTLPYADAFLPTIKYCISFESTESCRLRCSIGVRWLKSILVKGMVNRAAMKGMQETIGGLIPILEQQVSKMEGKSVTPREVKVEKKIEEKKEGGSRLNGVTFVLGLLICLFTIYQYLVQQRYQAVLSQHQRMNWRGVYLKDLELTAGPEPNRTEVYQIFHRLRQGVTDYDYRWVSRHHREMAIELSFSRERLGVIRYELLSTFRVLNKLEHQLLENEYWNWIADKRLDCQKDNLCEALSNELNII